ncbi:MAG: hypothetical protein AAF702_38525 [Chloroflexota bacterium]
MQPSKCHQSYGTGSGFSTLRKDIARRPTTPDNSLRSEPTFDAWIQLIHTWLHRILLAFDPERKRVQAWCDASLG